MVILKKVKSATLVETLVATALIVIVFVIASLTINNVLLNDFNNNTNSIENRLYELEYALQNNTIDLPYSEEFENWNITVEKNDEYPQTKIIEFKAENTIRQHLILKKRVDE